MCVCKKKERHTYIHMCTCIYIEPLEEQLEAAVHLKKRRII